MTDTTLFKTAKNVSADLNMFVEPENEKVTLLGYHFHEAGSPARRFEAEIRNGPLTDSREIFPIEGNRNSTLTYWFGPNGIECYKGISVRHVRGTYDVTLIYRR